MSVFLYSKINFVGGLMSALNELNTLKRIKNNYKKLLELFPDDLVFKQYFKNVSKSIDNLKREALKKMMDCNN